MVVISILFIVFSLTLISFNNCGGGMSSSPSAGNINQNGDGSVYDPMNPQMVKQAITGTWYVGTGALGSGIPPTGDEFFYWVYDFKPNNTFSFKVYGTPVDDGITTGEHTQLPPENWREIWAEGEWSVVGENLIELRFQNLKYLYNQNVNITSCTNDGVDENDLETVTQTIHLDILFWEDQNEPTDPHLAQRIFMDSEIWGCTSGVVSGPGPAGWREINHGIFYRLRD